VAGLTCAADSSLDLFNAAIILPSNASPRVKAYAALFTDEAAKRCGALWHAGAGPMQIRLLLPHQNGSEGFTVGNSNKQLLITAHSERGLLYGLGYLLRNIEFAPQHAFLPLARAETSSAPAYRLRGHQLGYRPKTNSYDGWDVAQWHQYIRDLAVFGINAIEILPPQTDDQATSPLFPLPPEQMMVEVSRLADQYGLDVWMWYPAMGSDYDHPDKVTASLKEWAAVFEKLPRLDAIFTPGGDPGDTAPDTLLALLKLQKQNLRRYHPNGQMWVSPQSFGAQHLIDFLAGANRADWLDGVVHGPQCRIALPDLRRKLRKDLPIRLYPDITHSLQCQFPVANWKREFAFTEGRECINPRPQSFTAIARQYLPDTIGFLSYSEGCNDDVNKAVWSSAAWNPNFAVDECLLEYSRYFINAPQAHDFATGVKQLEQTWIDPTTSAGDSLTLFQTLEKEASPATSQNWRFQQALYRAYYDAYSYGRLRGYGNVGLRDRVFELAKDLFQSIRMQLDVKHYKAESVERGANLDTLDSDLFGPPHETKVGQGSFYDDFRGPTQSSALTGGSPSRT
jgi:hypothetical protein